MYAGVDEAGRGPVLGPLVIAGIAGDPRDLPPGVTDSKKLTPARRQALHAELTARGTLRYHVLEVPAAEIDARSRKGESLNAIEEAGFLEVLRELDAPRAVVDALGANPAPVAGRLTAGLEGSCQVEARVGADATDPLVGAASILAKVTRDRAIGQLAERLGCEIGSGYPSDPKTQAFLRAWRDEHAEPPPGARTTWATLARYGYNNRTLTEFPEPHGGDT